MYDRYTLQLGPASTIGGDDAYDGKTTSLSFQNLDDDVAGVLVEQPADILPEVLEALAAASTGTPGARYT